MAVIKVLHKKSGNYFDVFYDDQFKELIESKKWYIDKKSNKYSVKTSWYDDYTKLSKTRFMHRVILRDTPLCIDIDHINRNQLDNRLDNLRLCSRKENSYNRGKNKNNSNNYKGVHKYNGNKFKAGISVDGKRLHLGVFDTQEQAAIAYNNASKKHFKEYAYLNDF